jgi:hypothetical protein
MEVQSAKLISAEGAKQYSRGRKPREKQGGETSPERAAQVFRYFTTCVAPAGLQLCQFLTQGSARCAFSTLGFTAPRFQRYSHAQIRNQESGINN